MYGQEKMGWKCPQILGRRKIGGKKSKNIRSENVFEKKSRNIRSKNVWKKKSENFRSQNIRSKMFGGKKVQKYWVEKCYAKKSNKMYNWSACNFSSPVPHWVPEGEGQQLLAEQKPLVIGEPTVRGASQPPVVGGRVWWKGGGAREDPD